MANGRDWGYKVVREIRIYVEGGGDGKDQKSQIRKGFSEFFYKAVGKRIKIIACGNRVKTFRDFQLALKTHPRAFNLLLVDSEGPVNSTPWQHLHNRTADKWRQPQNATNEHCHLMVQMMEAWFIADLEAIKRFYGQGFNVSPIPKNTNVEDIPKETLISAFQIATKNTIRGQYGKIKHGSKILEQLDADKVRTAAPHCNRLLTTLTEEMNAPL